MIAIHDNLINSQDLHQLKEKYLQNGLFYGWKANTRKKYDQGHWNINIFSSNNNKLIDHSVKQEFYQYRIISKMWSIFNYNFGNMKLLQCYINGYTYGTDGYAHTDVKNELITQYPELKFETIIVYLNNHWNIDYAGETVIFNSQQEIEKSILPKFGRVLLFNSEMLHAARPLSRICPELRLVLIFKTCKYIIGDIWF